MPLSGTGKPGGAANILVNGTFNGLYRFAFNDQTLAYAVTPLLASPYATMSVAGTFNGWNPAANNMQLIANNTWQYDAAFSAATNVQFKFAANGNWTNNWGDSSQTVFTPPLSGTGQQLRRQYPGQRHAERLLPLHLQRPDAGLHHAVNRTHRRHQPARPHRLRHPDQRRLPIRLHEQARRELHRAGDDEPPRCR